MVRATLFTAAALFLAAPSARAQAGAITTTDALGFNNRWLADQSRVLESDAPAPSSVHLDHLALGGLTLGFTFDKAVTASAVPALHLTVADAQRDWLQSMGTDGPQKFGFTGAVETGAARGFSFQTARQGSGGGLFSDTRMAFNRSGLTASVRWRDVSNAFTRTANTTDAEWNDAKSLLGWKQSDMAFGWAGTPHLSLAASMTQATQGGTGATRSHSRWDAAWTPASSTRFALYTDGTANGTPAAADRTQSHGFSLDQSLHGGLAFTVAEDDQSHGTSRSTSRRFAFHTKENAATWFSAQSTDTASQAAARRREQKFAFRSALTRALSVDSAYLKRDEGQTEFHDGSLALKWKPTKQWDVSDSLRSKTGALGAISDLHFAGGPDAHLRIEGRFLHQPDGTTPFKDKNTLHLERDVVRATRLTVDWLGVVSNQGDAARVTTFNLLSKLPSGSLALAWRSNGRDLYKGYQSVSWSSDAAHKSPFHWNAQWKQYVDAPVSQSVRLSWAAAKRFSLEGSIVAHPEDAAGNVLNDRNRSLAIHWDALKELRLDVAAASSLCGTGGVDRLDANLHGRINRFCTLDAGLNTRREKGISSCAAYHLAFQNEVDKSHRLAVSVERQARAVQGHDAMTARLEVMTDF